MRGSQRAMLNEDCELVARSQRGDTDACAQLMGRYRERAYTVAYAVVGDHDEAEDVVQEAFVRAFRAMRDFRQGHSFLQWMRRITVNCAISSLRRRRPQTSENPGGTLLAAPASDPAEEAAATELDEAVRRALEDLPLRQRVALTLFALEEMDLESTARAMDCAVGTVKSHIHRARAKLRRALADHLSEDQRP